MICLPLCAENWNATMTTKELQMLIDRANRLLKRELPPKDRLRIATMKLGD
jgi:hypothetical protein